MAGSFEPPLVVQLADEPRGLRGRPLVAWLVILAVLAFVVWRQNEVVPRVAAANKADLNTQSLALHARMLVAAKDMLGQSGDQLKSQLDLLDKGPVADRLRVVVLSGEIEGIDQARERLTRLTTELGQAVAVGAVFGSAERLAPDVPAFGPQHVQLAEILEKLYADFAAGELSAPSLTDAERELLRSELDWFGELALAPAGSPDPEARTALLEPARRLTLTLSSIILVVVLVTLAGLIGLIVFVILLFAGKVRGGFTEGSPYGGVYAETFAAWLVLFTVLSFFLPLLPVPRGGLLLSLLAFVLSLAALAWPVLRGIPWARVRADIGLTAGRLPLAEPFLGIATYIMALPLMFLGVILTMLLMHSSFGQAAKQPTHPVVEMLPHLDWWGKLQIVLLACVAAPLAEETLFRGVLYRHLRELSRGLGQAVSVLASGFVVSFIFAGLHPQGVLGVPPLVGLALAFSFAREWRGTLVPAMVAHGIQNGLSLLAVMFLLGE